MRKPIEAIVDPDGTVHLLEVVRLDGRHRALVTILDEPEEDVSLTALLSEPALTEDWDRPEEDDAWKHLQPDR